MMITLLLMQMFFKTKLNDFIVSKDTNCNLGKCGSGEGGLDITRYL